MLLHILEHTVMQWPDQPAIDDGERVLSYTELARAVQARAVELRSMGIGVGDRVGVRVPSGSAELYVAILSVLAAGAAYVPVDADDPDERAELVWRESGVCAVIGAGRRIATGPIVPPSRRGTAPGLADDAWIIFTSGSGGTPKGVAVSHRAAAAFVDAEARLFLRDDPVRPGDRVLAGLSVAFDASCEEMWLAWRHGACLVPAPRSVVRAGADLGPWLAERRVTVVSTVPTLAALWSPKMLAGVRLLIVGGEACPPDVVRRFATPDRELWNTYGPTEATVVSCAARLYDGEPVRIGLPLDGWRLAVVDPSGRPVRWGEIGELVIGGVGLGRYLDPGRDAEKYAAMPSLGWGRAYRSGDLVRAVPEGLEFVGRADDQVKIGGRRIELGEIEAEMLALPSVAAAAAVVKRTAGGLDVLVGYVVPVDGDPCRFDKAAAARRLRERLPAALVPRLAVLESFPVRGSGKVDRTALPWPLPAGRDTGPVRADETTAWLMRLWTELLGTEAGPDDDFFDLGGTSLAVARLVTTLRERYPSISMIDVYRHPTPATLRGLLAGAGSAGTEPSEGAEAAPADTARPAGGDTRTPRWTGWVQATIQTVLLGVSGLRLVLAIGLVGALCSAAGADPVLPALPWWVLLVGLPALFTQPGRVVLAAAGARLLRGRLKPGDHRRGGGGHLRLWAAERLVATLGVTSVLGTPLAVLYGRLLGCRVGKDVDLHALPPVTGLARIGDGAAIEPGVDMAGWWLDADRLRIGEVRVGAGARVGARSVLMPGTAIGDGAEVLRGGCVTGTVPDGECWGGSPAARRASSSQWPAAKASRSWAWQCAYLLGTGLRSLISGLAAVPAVALAVAVLLDGTSLTSWILTLAAWMPVLVVVTTVCHLLLLAATIRTVGLALSPGTYRVHGAAAWAAWMTHTLLDDARRTLFPVYASLITPLWMRLLGARIGRSVEVSTVLALPKLLDVGAAAFLADDVLAAPYELRGGRMRLGRSRIGSRAFVGNSGMVGPQREVGDDALIGVLSDTPDSVPPGTSWLGRPAMRLRRKTETHDPARTFAPPRSLLVARGAVESCRVVPPILSGLLLLAVAAVLLFTWSVAGAWAAVVVAGPVLFLAGIIAGAVTTAAKWVLMGKFSTGRHPLWSAFVWRNELWDVFMETLAVPWLVQNSLGTPVLNWWLRSLGARIGRGVWCETHWLPEPDLIELGEGSSVNRGCVLQTHLFHDRVMQLDAVRLDRGATLGPVTFVLPGGKVGEATTVGAGSLVMAGECVPGRDRWHGTPVIRAA
ncbi:Pls/PosA family non-ribosomal peptide synthetase [Actinomadura rugatobispora]|uniref:Pls/PosA family non-ribosomal peptide synthetase n=1 Tax=Actinomadura rugatobispora TaxID=1994 RepID=A0ABW1A7M3_9ACTN